MGYHVIEIPIANSIFLVKVLLAFQAVYFAAISTIKLSCLLFYLRLFSLREHRIWVWICMGIIPLFWLGGTLQVFLLCTPFKASWDPILSPTHCANSNVAFVTMGIFNMLSDLMIMLLPIPFIRKLQMTRAAKFGLIAIFGIGLLCVPLGAVSQDDVS